MEQQSDPSQALERIGLYEPSMLLLCKICRAAIRPKTVAVKSHYRKQHGLGSKALQGITMFVHSHRANLNDPNTVELPINHSSPVSELPILGGFSCTQCPYLTTNKNVMCTHQRQLKHCLDAGQTGWIRVALQTFTRGAHARYWIVDVMEVSNTSPTGSEGDSADVQDAQGSQDDGGQEECHNEDQEEIQKLIEMVETCERELLKEEEERPRPAETAGGVDAESRWVKLMKWAEHLQQKDRAALHRAGLLPTARAAEERWRNDEAIKTNQRLRQLAASFDRVLIKSIDRLDQVPEETLRWLASIDAARPARQPFGRKQEAITMDRYSSYMQRYLCYCARVWPLGRSGAGTKHGIRFTTWQWASLDNVIQRLDTLVAMAPNDEVSEREALDRAVFQFCISSIKQKLGKNPYRNPLLHFTAVLGINRTGESWVPSSSHVRFLAGFLWCGRVLMLEHLFEDARANLIESDDSDDNGKPSREVSLNAIVRFQEGHRQWLADGSYTPFSSIIQWMAHRRRCRANEGGPARLAWKGDGRALNYQGSQIHVGGFQKMAQAAIQEAEVSMDRLMLGHWGEVKRTICLRDIVDSLVYEGPERSFATNRRNAWLRPGAGRIMELVGRSLWEKVNDTNGQIRYECRQRQVEKYILELEQFKSRSIPAVHIWAGQPGHGPEMATIRHCDTEELQKNIFIFDGQMMLVTDRDKGRWINGRGRVIARFLPEQLSLMMVAYIAWLLPFEKVLHRLSRIRGPSHSIAPWVWKTAEQGIWNTERLSEQLGLLTKKHLGISLGASDYRDVVIKFGRRIKGLVIQQLEINASNPGGHDEDDENEDGDEYIDPLTGTARKQKQVEYVWDLQATLGSFAARNSYAVNVLCPGQLQPEMISNFQGISRVWHAFLERTDGQFVQKRSIRSADAEEDKASELDLQGSQPPAKRQRQGEQLTVILDG